MIINSLQQLSLAANKNEDDNQAKDTKMTQSASKVSAVASAPSIQSSSLMEDNLYNTIHMLQKMRHLSFELGMVPNLFEPSTSTPSVPIGSLSKQSKYQFDSSENAQIEVEQRIQKIGQM